MAQTAGLIGTVYARMQLDYSGYQSQLLSVGAVTQKTLSGISQGILRLGGLGTGLYAIKKGIDACVGAFMNFDQQMHNIWTLVDATEDQMRDLAGQLRTVSREYNQNATEVAKAMYEIYSATFYGADAMSILDASLKGAAAGLTNVFTAVDVTTTVLNAYRMSAEKATYVNDILFQTVKYGKTIYSELADQFGRLAGVAAPVGASLEEMAAAIATLTRAGIQTDWAITSLRQVLMQILRPGKDLTNLIQAMGYATGRALVESEGFAGAIRTIFEASEKAGTPLEDLFANIRAVTAILPLATTLSGEYTKDLARMAEATGQTEQAFSKMRQSFQYQFQQIKTRLYDMAISIGTVVVPALSGLMQVIDKLAAVIKPFFDMLAMIGVPQLLAFAGAAGAVFLALKIGVAVVHAVSAGLGKLTVDLSKATAATLSFAAATNALTGAQLKNLGTNISMGFAPAQIDKRTLLQKIFPGLVGMSKGSALLSLGGAALGLSVMMKGIVNLDIAFGEVTGAEATKAAITGALQDAFGGALAGLMLAKLFGATGWALAGGALAGGVAVAGIAALTVYVVHTVQKAAAKREEALPQARELARLILGTSTLPATLAGVRGEASRFPMATTEAGMPPTNKEETLAKLVEELIGASGLASAVDEVGKAAGDTNIVMDVLVEQLKALYSSVGTIYNPEYALSSRVSALMEAWHLTNEEAAGIAGRANEVWDTIVAAINAGYKPDKVSDSGIGKLARAYRERFEREAVSIPATDMPIILRDMADAYATNTATLLENAAAYGVTSDVIGQITDYLTTEFQRLEQLPEDVDPAVIDESAAAIRKFIAEATALTPAQEKLAVVAQIIAALPGVWAEAIYDAFSVTAGEVAKFKEEIGTPGTVVETAEPEKVRQQFFEDYRQAAMAEFDKMFAEIRDSNILTTDQIKTKWGALESYASLWENIALAYERTGNVGAAAARETADAFARLLGKDLPEKVISFAEQIQTLALELGGFGTTFERKIEITGELQSLGEKLYEMAQDPVYARFHDALMGLVDALEESSGIIVRDRDAESLKGAWEGLSSLYERGIIGLDGFILRLKMAAEATSDPQAAMEMFYSQLGGLASDLENTAAVQKFFQEEFEFTAERAKALAEALSDLTDGPAAAAWKNISDQYRQNTIGLQEMLSALVEYTMTLAGDKQMGTLSYFYEKISELATEYESSVTAQRLFAVALEAAGWSADDAADKAKELADALAEAAEAADTFASRVANLKLEGMGEQLDKAITEQLGNLKSALSGQFGTTEQQGQLSTVLDIISGIEQGSTSIKSAADQLEQIANSASPLVDPNLRLAARAAADELNAFGEVLGKTDEQIAKEAEDAAAKAKAAAEKAQREAEQAARDAADAMQEAFRKQFLAPISEALKTGDWLGAAEVIRGFAAARGDLTAMAESLSDANGKVITQADVLDLIMGAQRELLSTLDTQIEVMKLAGEDASALEQLKKDIEALFDPLGAFKRKLGEIVGAVFTSPFTSGKGIRDMLMGMYGRGTKVPSFDSLAPGAGVEVTGSGMVMLDRGEVVLGAKTKTLSTSGGDSGWCTGDVCFDTVEEAASALGTTIEDLTRSCSTCAKTASSALGPSLEEAAKAVAVNIQAIVTDWDSMTEAQLADAQAGSEQWRLGMTAYRETISYIETLIGDFDLLDLETESLVTSLSLFKAGFSGLPEATANVMVAIERFSNRLSDSIEKYIDPIQGFLEQILPGELADMLGPVRKIFDSVAAVNPQDMATSFTALQGGNLAGAVAPFISGGGLDVVTSVIAAVTKLVQIIADFVSVQMERLNENAKEVLEGLGEVVRDGLGRIRKAAEVVASAFGNLTRAAGSLLGVFRNLVSQTQIYSRLQTALATIQKNVWDALLGFLWPLVALFEKLAGVVEETEEEFSDLNVPTGYKVTRAEWKAATPGEPGIKMGGSVGKLPEWVYDLLEKFGDAIEAALAPFREFLDIMRELAKGLGEVVLSAALPAIQEFGEMLVVLAEKVRDTLGPLLTEHLPGIISGAIEFFGGAVIAAATLFVDTLANVLPNLEEFMVSLGDIGTLLPSIAAAIAEGLSKPLNEFVEGMTVLAQRIAGELIPELVEHLPGIVQGVGDLLFGYVEGLATGFTSLLIQTLPDIEEFALALGRIGDELPGLFVAVADALAPVVNTILTGLTELASWIASTLIPDLIGFLDGFRLWYESDAAPFIETEVFTLIGEVAQSFYDSLGEVVNFFVKDVWPWIKTDLWATLGEGIKQVTGSLTKIWESIEQYWPSVEDLLESGLKKWVDSLTGKLDEAHALLLAKMGKTSEAIHAIWESEGLSFWQKAKDTLGIAFMGFFSTLEKMFGPTFKTIGDALATLFSALKPLTDILGIIGKVVLFAFKEALEVVAGVVKLVADAFKVLMYPINLLATWFHNLVVAIHNIVEFIKHPFKPGERDIWEPNQYQSFNDYMADSSPPPSAGGGSGSGSGSGSGGGSGGGSGSGSGGGSGGPVTPAPADASLAEMLRFLGYGSEIPAIISKAKSVGLSEAQFAEMLRQAFAAGVKPRNQGGQTAFWRYFYDQGYNIPYLSKGGVVTKSGLVYAHAPEAFLPLARTVPLSSAAGGLGGAINLTNVVKLDSRTLMKETRRIERHNEKITSGTGHGRRWERAN